MAEPPSSPGGRPAGSPFPRLRRLGLRNEFLILPPVAVLLLIVLSAVVLFSTWQGLNLLAEERREESLRLVRRLAGLIASGEVTEPGAFRRLVPDGARLALIDAEGSSRVLVGRFEETDLLPPAGRRDASVAFAVGPLADGSDRVVAFAPLEVPGGRRILRLDLPATRLAGLMRSARVLLWVVVAADLVVAALVVLLVRKMLSPLDTMLARAREVAPVKTRQEDEVSYLLSTFEQALAAFSRPAPETGEAEMRALERTLGASLESGLLLFDRVGRTVALNAVGAALLGMAKPEPGVPLGTLLSAHPELRDLLGRAVEKGEVVQREEVEIAVGGSALTLGLTVHPMRRDSGEIHAFLVLFADLTEARRIREERRLSTTLEHLGELAAGVAHEMRNSLATLTGYLTLIERAPGEDEIREYVGELRRETDHIRRVLEDFLSFARPGSVQMEQIDLERIARRAADDPALGRVVVRVERIGEGASALHGDAQLLERAVRNLLRNSAEAQRRQGTDEPVDLIVEASDEVLRLTVADRGDGIAPAMRARLFQPFSSSSEEGVGLGLALARRIVDLHGGGLTLTDRVGGGTEATIRFERGRFVT